MNVHTNCPPGSVFARTYTAKFHIKKCDVWVGGTFASGAKMRFVLSTLQILVVDAYTSRIKT
jgi:hypothetical protein